MLSRLLRCATLGCSDVQLLRTMPGSKDKQTASDVPTLLSLPSVEFCTNIFSKIYSCIAYAAGAILTKMDGDSRGGAALSVKAVSGKPIKFVGTGEKLEALEPFYPDRIASRILGDFQCPTLVSMRAVFSCHCSFWRRSILPTTTFSCCMSLSDCKCYDFKISCAQLA